MKLPDDIRRLLAQQFRNRHRRWLGSTVSPESGWPLEVALGVPTEQLARHQLESVRVWVSAWQKWTGVGRIEWCERRWANLGFHRLPAKLILQDPKDVAAWLDQSLRWDRAKSRFQELTHQWPALDRRLAQYFDVLADYSDEDFQRLKILLAWIELNPRSGLHSRQIPVAGLDTKWLEHRKKLIAELIATIRGCPLNDLEFYGICGLIQSTPLIRLRMLDPSLRNAIGGLRDITSPVPEIAALRLPISTVYIVENIETGLAFSEMPRSAVFMGLGYSVSLLAQIPWIFRTKSIYWGDLDTHGFAILSRARTCLPKLRSVLMDEPTLMAHKELWVQEKEQYSAADLSLLTDEERAVYQGLKCQRWGPNVRLEQERVSWNYAWQKLQQTMNLNSDT